MGENLVGASHSFTAALAADGDGSLGSKAQLAGRSVYFDILGLVMVTYNDSIARVLHHLPLLLLTVLLPLGEALMVGFSSGSCPGLIAGFACGSQSIWLFWPC